MEHLGIPEPRLHSAAPPASLAAPNVRLLDGSNRDEIRTVRLHVSGPADANLIVLETASEVIGATIDGKPVADRPVLNSSAVPPPWTLTFWNPPTRGFDLTLKLRTTAAVRVTARASTPGLPSTPGTADRDRPPDTMPITTDPLSIEQDSSTVVSKSFSFVAP